MNSISRRVKEFILGKMESGTKVNGSMDFLRDVVLKNYQMAQFMMVSGRKVYQKDKVFVSIQIIAHMMANGKKVNHMDKEKRLFPMGLLLMEDGSKEKLGVTELKSYLTEQFLKENGKRVVS